MSRSFRHTPVCGLTCAASEKDDKRRWHRRFRHHSRQRVHQRAEPLPLRLLSDPWLMAKDGKQWFGRIRFPRLMRK
jgi:hypothetical protein